MQMLKLCRRMGGSTDRPTTSIPTDMSHRQTVDRASRSLWGTSALEEGMFDWPCGLPDVIILIDQF